MRYLIVVFIFIMNVSYCESIFPKSIEVLVQHVMSSIEKAESFSSGLDESVLKMPGYSSPKVRHFMNNLCSIQNIKYLEIGVWQGSTFVSALYNNQKNIVKAFAIDNWSELGGPRIEFLTHIDCFLPKFPVIFYEKDCFSIDLACINEKINVYFYDGDHSEESQKLAFTYFNDIFEDVFIVVVDDYNYSWAQEATQEAIKELNYTVHFDKYLPSSHNSDKDSWWNGLYVAVLSKTATP